MRVNKRRDDFAKSTFHSTNIFRRHKSHSTCKHAHLCIHVMGKITTTLYNVMQRCVLQYGGPSYVPHTISFFLSLIKYTLFFLLLILFCLSAPCLHVTVSLKLTSSGEVGRCCGTVQSILAAVTPGSRAAELIGFEVELEMIFNKPLLFWWQTNHV